MSSRSRSLSERNELIKLKRLRRFKKRRQELRQLGQVIHYCQTSRPSGVWPDRAPSVRTRRGWAEAKVPDTFSFIEDPEATIEFLDKLNSTVSDRMTKHLHVDHSRCKRLDLCASLVMDTLIEQRRRSRGLGLAGHFSNDERVNLMLRASGLLERIEHPESLLSWDVAQKVRKSELFSGVSKYSEKSSRCDEAATRLTDYFNECLGMVKAKLSELGKNQLSVLISEAISNAEEHSRGKWFAKAHYDRLKPAEQEGGACHIVLVNFGPTIFDSFKSPKAAPERLNQILTYARKHLGNNLLSKAYDEEALCTLCALQEGVTSLPEARGTGTTKLVDFFLRLAGKKPRMCVVSGRAYILFDGSYQLKRMPFPGGDRQVIAFNNANTLDEPPDGNYVRTLAHSFPGTLISLKFNLKESYAPPSSGTV